MATYHNTYDEVCANCLRRRGAHFSSNGKTLCDLKSGGMFVGLQMYRDRFGNMHEKSAGPTDPNLSFRRMKVRK